MHNSLTVDELRQQCAFYMREFGINEVDLISGSYSDMLMGLESASESKMI
jgi:hypothetical protein